MYMFQAPLQDPRVGQKVPKSFDQDLYDTKQQEPQPTKHFSSWCLDTINKPVNIRSLISLKGEWNSFCYETSWRHYCTDVLVGKI